MSDVEMQGVETQEIDGQAEAPREPAPPIESRFLFVDVAALRAKQLRRGAKARLTDDHGQRPIKAERMAMAEVKNGLVEWQLPEFEVIFDTR